MFVKYWMNQDFPSIRINSTVQEALSVMRKYKVDYCVTTDEAGKFQGFVYKSNLADSELDSSVFDHVVFPDFYAYEDSYIEEAALTFRESHEACLAVVDQELNVKGIITLSEILEAFVAITAMDEPGTRVLMKLEDKPGQLKEIFDVLAQNKMNVLSVNTIKEDGFRRVSIKVDTCEPEELAKTLKIFGIEYDRITREEGF